MDFVDYFCCHYGYWDPRTWCVCNARSTNLNIFIQRCMVLINEHELSNIDAILSSVSICHCFLCQEMELNHTTNFNISHPKRLYLNNFQNTIFCKNDMESWNVHAVYCSLKNSFLWSKHSSFPLKNFFFFYF